jgi:hypothetical protein
VKTAAGVELLQLEVNSDGIKTPHRPAFRFEFADLGQADDPGRRLAETRQAADHRFARLDAQPVEVTHQHRGHSGLPD